MSGRRKDELVTELLYVCPMLGTKSSVYKCHYALSSVLGRIRTTKSVRATLSSKHQQTGRKDKDRQL